MDIKIYYLLLTGFAIWEKFVLYFFFNFRVSEGKINVDYFLTIQSELTGTIKYWLFLNSA